jgi:hypothetical protein
MTEAQFLRKQKAKLAAEAKRQAALHKKQAEKELETQRQTLQKRQAEEAAKEKQMREQEA